MKRSTNRILTTHTGSLPRPADLLELIHARENGDPYDEQVFQGRVHTAVADIVRQQVEAGNEASPQQATGYQKEDHIMMRNHGFSNSSL